MPFLLDDTEVNRPAYSDLEVSLVSVTRRRKMKKALTVRRLQEVELRRRLLDLRMSGGVSVFVKEHQESPASHKREGSRKKYRQSYPDLYRLLTLVLQQQTSTSQSPQKRR